MAEEDRTSSLPDHILLEIISRIKIMDKRKKEERLMSTKEVIRTTATISKRWQHLWTRLPTLIFKYNQDLNIYGGYTLNDVTNYFSFIDKTLTQCSTDVSLKKFKLHILQVGKPTTTQFNRWLRYAITRNVQEIDLKMMSDMLDELFFNNSCLVSMKLSFCTFIPPKGVIRWDKLKYIFIDKWTLNEDLIGKILSGSPCLETLELNDCYVHGRIPNSLLGNFGVFERLSCNIETYERFSYEDELFLDDSFPNISMKLSRYVFNPPNGAISLDKLTFLCIDNGELDEDSIEKLLSRSPCLETLELKECCGFRRINVTSKSVKNLVISGYGYRCPLVDYYIKKLEINAPYILSLTIKGKMYLEELSLENVSSLVKADLNYLGSNHFAKDLRLSRYDIEEELLQGILSRLDHVNEIALGDYNCLEVLSDLEAKGFQFRKGSNRRGVYPSRYKVFSLIHK